MSSSSLQNLPSYEELYPADGNPPTYYDQTKKCSFVNERYFDADQSEPLSNAPEENSLENLINHLFLARIGELEFGTSIRSSEVGITDRIASEDVEVEVPEIVDDWSHRHQMERHSLRRNIISEAVSGTAIISAVGLMSAVYIPVLLPIAVVAMSFHVFTILYKVWYFRMRFGSFADELHAGHDEY